MTSLPAIIEQKRDGGALSRGEIEFAVRGYTAGTVPDYQMAALLMAIVWRGMDADETAALTECMLASGGTLGRLGDGATRVDKHSTGGVGDKTSLVLAPLLACCGVQVPMISGRGLGATGGTLDKLESIPGFRTALTEDEIRGVLQRTGCVICGQTEDLVPADKRLYALRDVTGTVPSVPLITASIMSKKLAENLDALVLDVKWGSGAFMRTREQAERLRDSLLAVGRRTGLATAALLSDMNQPLGRLAGNAVEVQESIAALVGGGPPDLRDLVLALGAAALHAADPQTPKEEHARRLREKLDSGEARERFDQMVAAQGGDATVPLEVAAAVDVCADRSGRVTRIHAGKLGQAVVALGGGRRKLDDAIDHSVGFELCARLGQQVAAGETLIRLFARQRGRDEAEALVRAAIEVGEPQS